jgi:hypothetical protein
MKRMLTAALAAVVLFAPAALPAIRGYQFAPAYRPDAPKLPEPVIGSYEAIHTVAVISGIGTQFDLERRGHATKKQGALDIAAWKLDDRAEAAVRNAMPGPYTFLIVPYDHAALASLSATAANAAAFEAFLKALPANGVDAFIIVRPNSIGGLALQSVEHGDTILWVDFEIDVVDARTLQVIARSTARVQPPGAPHPNFPGLVLGKEFVLDGSLAVSAENREKLRLLTDEMLAVTISETLRSLKLGAGS